MTITFTFISQCICTLSVQQFDIMYLFHLKFNVLLGSSLLIELNLLLLIAVMICAVHIGAVKCSTLQLVALQ